MDGPSGSARGHRTARGLTAAVSGGQFRQVSFSATVPPLACGTVATRLAPLSQVTEPSEFLRRYLYSKRVPAGSDTEPRQTG